MLIQNYMVIFLETNIFFRVIHLKESYHRLYFNIIERYVYYEAVKLYLI